MAAVVLPAARGTAQRPTVVDVSLGPAAAVARRTFAGVGAWIGRRLDSQSRLAGGAAGGVLDGRSGLRVEVLAHLIVNPTGRGGAGLYAGAGVAWQGARGAAGTGYVVALLGLESAPDRARGWFAEIGLGGGARLVAGLRWRRLAAAGRRLRRSRRRRDAPRRGGRTARPAGAAARLRPR